MRCGLFLCLGLPAPGLPNPALNLPLPLTLTLFAFYVQDVLYQQPGSTRWSAKTTCVACPAGKFWPPQQYRMFQPLVTGSDKNRHRNPRCTVCPAGKHQPRPGKLSCEVRVTSPRVSETTPLKAIDRDPVSMPVPVPTPSETMAPTAAPTDAAEPHDVPEDEPLGALPGVVARPPTTDPEPGIALLQSRARSGRNSERSHQAQAPPPPARLSLGLARPSMLAVSECSFPSFAN